MATADEPLDAVTLSVLWNSLISAAEEMGTALRRTAYSEAVREGEDFSTGLFDARGRLIAQGNFSPGHLGSMPYVMRHVLEYVPARDLREGDGVLLNDSALGSGHFPDFFLVSPAFDGSRLVGFAVNCAHQVDVGGAAAGSQLVAGITEAYQEGLRILPVRIFREGRLEPDLERLLLANVRLPDRLRGDLLAQRNANHLGCRRLVEISRRFGDLFEPGLDRILDRTEAAIAQALSAIPEGAYEYEDFLDDTGPGTEPVRVHVKVTVAGGRMAIDFSGSSPQVAAGINSYLNYTRAYAAFAMKVFTDPRVSQNEGAFRRLEVTAEPGSFFNPRFPAPSGGRATVQIRIFEAVNAALAQVLPERAMGAFSHWANPNLGGPDDGRGRPFVVYDVILGGYGGNADRDGEEGLCPVFNARNIPVEVHESVAPVRVERLELIPDSGGPGRHRGGCGLRKDVRLLAERATLTNLADRHRTPGFGLFGGRPGAPGRTLLDPDGDATEVGSKAIVSVHRGQLISFRTNGGGGYGDPWERDPELVAADVSDGLVSVEAARRSYGVVVALPSATVDREATVALRKRGPEPTRGSPRMPFRAAPPRPIGGS